MKEITNTEYNQALKDESNSKIIDNASYKYRRFLGSDIESHKMVALLEAMKTYNPNKGMKFSSWLYDCVRYKCYREANNLKRLEGNYNLAIKHTKAEPHITQTFIPDLLMSLNDRDAKLISDKFVDNKTLLEISNEYGVTIQAVHQRLNRVLKKVRAILTQ